MRTWRPFAAGKRTTACGAVLFLVFFLLGSLSSPRAFAQNGNPGARVSPDARAAVVRRVAAAVEDHYVFADVGKQMGDSLIRKLTQGEYDSITTFDGLVSQLTGDLQSISRDKHMHVYPYKKNPAWSEPDSIAQRDRELSELKRENFGFESAQVLLGNIGYVNIRQFYDPRHAAPTAIGAMNFLANCDALIIDLRENGGGYSTMNQLICSYLFDRPTLLTNFYVRDSLAVQDCTSPFVLGPKLADVPVYVLVSRLTFSAAEGFAFSLKNLGRATIIGETTGGGGNAIEYYHFAEEGVTVRVSTSQARDPLTGATFEGTGVKPDIEVPAFQALIIANVEALKRLLAGRADSTSRYSWQWALEDYQRQLDPIVLERRQLSEYVGKYGTVKMTQDCGRLYYQRPNRSRQELVAMGADSFKIYDPKGPSKNRIQFTRGKSGRIVSYYIHDWIGDRADLVMKDAK